MEGFQSVIRKFDGIFIVGIENFHTTHDAIRFDEKNVGLAEDKG